NNAVLASQPAGTVAATFIVDKLAFDPLASPPCSAGKKGDPTVYTGNSGEKNGDSIPSETWGSGSIPNNKDDLSNIYVYARKDTSYSPAHLVLFFGLERVATLGDSHIDFEFLKSGQSLAVDGADSNGCPSGHFVGARTAGDIII